MKIFLKWCQGIQTNSKYHFLWHKAYKIKFFKNWKILKIISSKSNKKGYKRKPGKIYGILPTREQMNEHAYKKKYITKN